MDRVHISKLLRYCVQDDVLFKYIGAVEPEWELSELNNLVIARVATRITDDMLPPDTDKAATTSHIPIHIKGSDKFQENIKNICKKYMKVFNTKLSRQPALITPMKLHVNHDIWQTKSNQGQCRSQTDTKQEEIRKQVLSLEQLEVVRISDASWYSQVHMQPKPLQIVKLPDDFGDQVIMAEIKIWRFCIDS